jgi:hypothetical protein
MSTPKQIAASRANGAKSKGPVTPQGKRNSSRNATRHGLLAETVVLEAENTGRFLELLESLIDEHQPQTPTETMLVDTIAVARWRQDRIWGMQKVAFDHDIASCDAAESSPLRAVLALRASPESIRTHELLLRYEIALDRQISRALLRLHQLQDRRSKPVEQPVAPHPVLRDSQEFAPVERTQQPVETAIQRPPVSDPPRQPAQPARQFRPSAPTVKTTVAQRPSIRLAPQTPLTAKTRRANGAQSRKES